MSKTGKKMNSTLLLLSLVLVAAIALSVSLYSQRAALTDQVNAMTLELEKSRNSWETTAALKEQMQAELNTVTEALREAQLTIQEAEKTTEKYNAQIVLLKDSTAGLTESVDAASASRSELDAQFDALQLEAAQAVIAKAELEQQIAGLNDLVSYLQSQRVIYQQKLSEQTAGAEAAAALESQLAELNRVYEEATQANATLQAEIDRLTAELAAAQQPAPEATEEPAEAPVAEATETPAQEPAPEATEAPAEEAQPAA